MLETRVWRKDLSAEQNLQRRYLLKQSDVFKNPNNRAYLEGTIVADLSFDYSIKDNKFFKTVVLAKRNYGIMDNIPVVASETLFEENTTMDARGKYVKIVGEYQSHNYQGEDGKMHVSLYVFAKDIKCFKGPKDEEIKNAVFLKGRICKEAEKTAVKKARATIVLEVPRAEGISSTKDFINCSSTADNAALIRRLRYGDIVEIYGNIESRRYLKKDPTTHEQGEFKTAYNVLIRTIYRSK